MSLLSAGQSNAGRPNILLIVMDAARAKNLSCYGYHQPTMPRMDRFAEESVVYEQAISAAGWSLPAHASIFTGLYPSKHGAHDQHKFLEPEHLTMAELLRAQGYQTLAFCLNQYVGPATGLNRGFEWFNRSSKSNRHPLGRFVKKVDHGLAKVSGQQDSGARYTNRELRAALPQLQANNRPFFIFINYLEPHVPYRSPQQYNRFLPAGVSAQQARQVNQNPWKYLTYPDSMTRRDFEILEALHNSALAYLDMRISEILDWLREAKMLDQTMVVITADHGENFGEHQLMGHGHGLYETLLHVPLIVHYPKGVTQPGRASHQVQTMDVLPTVLTMLGDPEKMQSSLQGKDLLGTERHKFTIAEQSKPDLNPFHRRFPGVDVSRYDRALQMIRTDRYKYIWSSTGQHELYDLPTDPAEEHNLIAQCPDIAQELDQRLNEWRNSFEPAVPTTEAPEFDEKIKAQLRALGYME